MGRMERGNPWAYGTESWKIKISKKKRRSVSGTHKTDHVKYLLFPVLDEKQ